LLSRRLSWPRAALVIAVASALAAVVAVAPSLAGSFLTSQRASKVYVTNKKAATLFLKKKVAGNTYVKKVDAPLPPVASIAASNAVFGPTSATTAGFIPTAFTSFGMPGVGPAVITFSGSGNCTAEKPTPELACPIQILVDEQKVAKVNFLPATATATKIAPIVNTVSISTVLQKGGHVVAIQYAGASKVTFTLNSWNLSAQAYPQRPEVPSTAESGK
jgi:hypothetical protein